MSTKRKSNNKSKSKRVVGLAVTKKKTVGNTGKTVAELEAFLTEDFFERLGQSIGYEAYEAMALDIAVRCEATMRAEAATDPEGPEEMLQFLDEYRLTHPEFTK
jgi:hypothetical protein